MNNHFSKKVSGIIEEHIEYHQVNGEFIAQQLGMSRMSLHRRLKQATGMSTSEFIHKIKVEKSKEYLLETQISISNIASQLGYNNTSYFIKQFKKITNYSPKGYRAAFSVFLR